MTVEGYGQAVMLWYSRLRELLLVMMYRLRQQCDTRWEVCRPVRISFLLSRNYLQVPTLCDSSRFCSCLPFPPTKIYGFLDNDKSGIAPVTRPA